MNEHNLGEQQINIYNLYFILLRYENGLEQCFPTGVPWNPKVPWVSAMGSMINLRKYKLINNNVFDLNLLSVHQLLYYKNDK